MMGLSERWLTQEESELGSQWVPICSYESVEFTQTHFIAAMANLVREPNINSTVIMRADILSERRYVEGSVTYEDKISSLELPEFSGGPVLCRDVLDVEVRKVKVPKSLTLREEIVRRIIPRNPYKDHIINQLCLMYCNSTDTQALVIYVPHISAEDETPFYLPPVKAIGIHFDLGSVTIHYIPFGDVEELRAMPLTDRPMRIALRLLKTASKHARGIQVGYTKRVHHDLVVPRAAFQNRYITLKQKYADTLVANWCESTDPKKHVFEDLAIAAFLIELWSLSYDNPQNDMQFRDLGCGNGLLVYILLHEGYNGEGVDARARKLWSNFPPFVQKSLKEQIVIPSVLLRPHPAFARLNPEVADNGCLFKVADPVLDTDTYYSSGNLLTLSKVCTADFEPNTFIIGNHSDEMTCWIPLLGYPFMVIPCCSHALSGARFRFPQKPSANSAYGALVDHVEHLAKQMGWQVKKEMLRIPLTRNAAIIGMERTEAYEKLSDDAKAIRALDIIQLEGGADGWVENSVALTKKQPRVH